MFKLKKIVIVVAAFMCVALVLSLLMRSFGSAGVVEEPEDEENDITVEEIECTSHVDKDDDELCDFCRAPFSDGIECSSHVDADDNELCDVCGESYTDGCDNHVDKDDNGRCDVCNIDYSDGDDFSGTPINVNRISNYDIFIDSYSLEKSSVPGFVTYGMYQRENTQLFFDNKFTYYTESSPSDSRFFGFYGVPDSVYITPEYLSLDGFDYFSVDFDVSSENLYPYVFQIVPLFKDANRNTLSPSNMYTYFEGRTDLKAHLPNNSTSYDVPEEFHITYLFDLAEGSFYVYINGEHIFSYYNLIADAEYFDHIRILIHEDNNVPGIEESISIDNIAIYSFGSGDGSYQGSLKDAIFDRTIKLQDCIDSVLYEGE